MAKTKNITKTKKAKEGDIIRSEYFSFGVYNDEEDENGHNVIDKSYIRVDGKTKEHPVKYRDSNSTFRNPKDLVIELGAYDESRGLAKFVVEEAEMEYGKVEHNDPVHALGWKVLARRLHKNGNYNPKGEVIDFYQGGDSTCEISEVELVGKMKKTFVRGK